MQRVLAAGTVVAACLVVAPGPAAAAPSDSDISAAQRAREQAAARVGAITGQLAGAQATVDEARIGSQIALQDYEERQGAYDEARAAADAAQAAAGQAAADVAVGKGEVAAFARDSYVQGSTHFGARALMTSGGPGELIERTALLSAVGEHRVDVLAELTVLQEQEVAARDQAAALATQQVELEQELEQAQQALFGLEGARQATEERAPAPRPAPTPAPAPAPTPAPAPAPAPEPAPAPVQNDAGAPSGSAVQTAIAAAKTQQGLPYSWGGGGSSGPSYGIPPDTGIWGFDCSGLTQYAYAQAGVAIGGTSREQWYRFRNQTVGRSDLQAGDLVFWGSGSNYNSIYHVALYLGGNKVIHARQSGDVVRISTMWFGSDYFGAVRPTA